MNTEIFIFIFIYIIYVNINIDIDIDIFIHISDGFLPEKYYRALCITSASQRKSKRAFY